MKRVRKKQLIFLSINVLILLVLFVSLRVYETRFRPPLPVYPRPLIEMEKIHTDGNPYFANFDRMELFSQYRGTRAVGAKDPGKMVILVPRGGYEQAFHVSRLLSEAYERDRGLVLMDMGDVRHFIPVKEGDRLLGSDERAALFISTMAAYMEQYGFTDFSVVYLGQEPSEYMREALSAYGWKTVDLTSPEGGSSLSVREEKNLIDTILES